MRGSKHHGHWLISHDSDKKTTAFQGLHRKDGVISSTLNLKPQTLSPKPETP